VLPDLGCYEERYRLTGSAVLSVAASLLVIGLSLWWHNAEVIIVLAVLLAVLPAQGGAVYSAARRAVAFRADHAGITLGAVAGKLPPRRGSAVFVPWADIEQIVFYPAYPLGRGRYGQARWVGIKRREGAPALSHGNEQAADCPVPGVATGATRKITGWHLDRERLAAVTTAMAPGIPIIDATPVPSPGIEGPGQPASTIEPGPVDDSDIARHRGAARPGGGASDP
jgi:hypothetical protein